MIASFLYVKTRILTWHLTIQNKFSKVYSSNFYWKLPKHHTIMLQKYYREKRGLNDNMLAIFGLTQQLYHKWKCMQLNISISRVRLENILLNELGRTMDLVIWYLIKMHQTDYIMDKSGIIPARYSWCLWTFLNLRRELESLHWVTDKATLHVLESSLQHASK